MSLSICSPSEFDRNATLFEARLQEIARVTQAVLLGKKITVADGDFSYEAYTTIFKKIEKAASDVKAALADQPCAALFEKVERIEGILGTMKADVEKAAKPQVLEPVVQAGPEEEQKRSLPHLIKNTGLEALEAFIRWCRDERSVPNKIE